MQNKSQYNLKNALLIVCITLTTFVGCSAQPAENITSDTASKATVVVSTDDDVRSSPEENDNVLPNLTGKWIGEACDYLDDRSIEYEIIYEYVENIEPNRVLSQDPHEGSSIEEGMKVKLVASEDQTSTISKTESEKENKAESKSENEKENKEESESESEKENSIQSQVHIDTTQKMPDIVGMDVNSATQTLDSMGIYYTGNYQFHDNIPKGQIISQQPDAGTDAPKGSRVTFIISDGKQPEQTVTTYEITEVPQEETPQQQDNTPTPQSNTSTGKKFRGSWYSFRPFAKITKQNGQYFVRIIWTGSATDGMMWIMFADYDPEQDILRYTDGKELPCHYDTVKEEWYGIDVTRYGLSGYFKINDNGEMLWYDNSVDGSSDIVFYKSE